MKGDVPAAALRLLQMLPVRVRIAPEPAPIRRTDDRSEYHRIWHDNNRKRRNAYQAEKQREYRRMNPGGSTQSVRSNEHEA